MPTVATQLASAIAIGVAWLPILVRFVRSWWARANPISLAICLLIGWAIYVPIWFVLTFEPTWPGATITALDGLTCVAFHAAVLAATRRFSDARS